MTDRPDAHRPEDPASIRAGFVREIRSLGGSNAFRVNGPDARSGPHKDRWEAQQDGVLNIDLPEDVHTYAGAELQLELWGGHPGTARKRFTLNDTTTLDLPEVGAADAHCTYSYPAVPLAVNDLHPGTNSFAFACDTGTAFWGHYLIRTACLRLLLDDHHPQIQGAGLAGLNAAVVARPSADDRDTLDLSLAIDEAHIDRVASVDFYSHHAGYDENGDTQWTDWHGFPKDGEPVGHIGTTTPADGLRLPYPLHMIPRNEPVYVRARIHWVDSDLIFETAAQRVAEADPTVPVEVIRPIDLPRPCWSRAGKEQRCTLPLGVEPTQLASAELHMVVWDGGSGTVSDPITLNDHPLPIVGTGQHDVLYRVVSLEPDMLVTGDNVVRVFSDTDHHGIEVLAPGPALIVRRHDAPGGAT